MKCIVCEKEILNGYPDEVTDTAPHQDMWDSGTVDLIIPGYGSNRDGDQLIIGICDDCIDGKIKSGAIIDFNPTERAKYNIRYYRTGRP